MLAAEFYAEVQRGINNLDNTIYIPSSEITMAFNKALYNYIHQFYTIFERDEESRKRLSKLIRPKIYTDTDLEFVDMGIPYNVYKVTLDDTIKFIVLEMAALKFEQNNQITYTSKVIPTNLNVVMANVSNPFKKPYSKKVWRIEGGDINGAKTHSIVVPKGFMLDRYTVSYITVVSIDDVTRMDLDINDYLDPMFQYELIGLVINEAVSPYITNGEQKSEENNNQKQD